MTMQGFRGQFTRIKGVSERRRLPRLGKIRLGIKKISKKSGKEYPAEVDYFVVPPEVEKFYGAQPKELDVMAPVNDLDVIFPQRYVWYGQSRGPKCIGNGETAIRVNEKTGEFEDRECPCELLEQKKCQRRAHLLLILPKISLGGVYQIDIGSYHSIVDINSGLEYVEGLIGRFAMIPLKLRRVPKDTYGSGSKQVHYTLNIHADVNIDMLNALRENTQKVLTGPQFTLPAPENINPVMDNGKVEYVDETDIIDMEDESQKSSEKGKKGAIPWADRVDNFVKIMQAYEDKLGQDVYANILLKHEVDPPQLKDMTEGKAMKLYADMEKAYQDTLETEGE